MPAYYLMGSDIQGLAYRKVVDNEKAFVSVNETSERTDCIYGFKHQEEHAHAVYVSGQIIYRRSVSGVTLSLSGGVAEINY